MTRNEEACESLRPPTHALWSHRARRPLAGATLFNWPRGVTVSTLDSESSDRGSNPREASIQMLTCARIRSTPAGLARRARRRDAPPPAHPMGLARAGEPSNRDLLPGGRAAGHDWSSKHLDCHSVTGPVAQWIRHRPTEPGIAGSSPAGVIILDCGAPPTLSAMRMAQIPPANGREPRSGGGTGAPTRGSRSQWFRARNPCLIRRDCQEGVWRNGSASDSRSEGWELESLCPHLCQDVHVEVRLQAAPVLSGPCAAELARSEDIVF